MVGNILCFDIGGTAIRSAICEADGRLGSVHRQATPALDRDAFITRIADAFAAETARPDAVAISLAGIVHPDTRHMIVANIPAIHGTDLIDDLEARLDVPVIIANDADCFAIAEAHIGSGSGHDIVFGIILGTGVGGGLVVNGRLVNERGGFAGEWGHGPVTPTRAGTPAIEIPHFACGCGVSGCLDTVAGARGIERLHSHIHRQQLLAPDILSAWRNGEPSARRTVDVYLDLIAAPLAMIVNLTGATVVPAGGGLAQDHALLAAIDRSVRPLTLARPAKALVVAATSGTEPGLRGAAIIAKQRLAQG